MLQIKSLVENNKKLLAIFVFFIFIFCIYFFIDPSKSSFLPQCPLKAVTGYECAGCGVQRSFHQLLHFQFLDAFKYNPLFVASIPVLLFVLIINLSKIGQLKQNVNGFFGSTTFYLVFLIIVFVFSLLKNTDFYKDFISHL